MINPLVIFIELLFHLSVGGRECWSGHKVLDTVSPRTHTPTRGRRERTPMNRGSTECKGHYGFELPFDRWPSHPIGRLLAARLEEPLEEWLLCNLVSNLSEGAIFTFTLDSLCVIKWICLYTLISAQKDPNHLHYDARKKKHPP